MRLLSLMRFEPERVVRTTTFPKSDGLDLDMRPSYRVHGPVICEFHPNGCLDANILGKDIRMRVIAERARMHRSGILQGDAQVYGDIARAYFEGRIPAYEKRAINETLFLLPVDREYLNDLYKRIERLEDVRMKGKHLPWIGRDESYANEKSAVAAHIRDLALWQMDENDCSDQVGIRVTELEKQTRKRLRRRFFFNRYWLRASKGGGDIYTPYNVGEETAIVSGYEPK